MSNPFRDHADVPIQAALVSPAIDTNRRDGTPLAALFLGLSAVATICGLLSFCFNETNQLPTVYLTAAAAIFGFSAAVLAFLFTFSSQASLIAAIVAMTLSTTMPLLMVGLPPEEMGQALLTSSLGCILMLIVAVIGRRKKGP